MTGEEIHLTPIQRRIMTILGDGFLHTQAELHKCLNDDLGPLTNVNAHISALRKKLRPVGRDIVYRDEGGVSHFLLIRLTTSPYRG